MSQASLIRRELLAGTVVRGDTGQTIEAAKQIVSLASKDPNSLIPHSNDLFIALTLKLSLLFEYGQVGKVWVQQTKNLLSALTKLSSTTEIVATLKYDPLYQLFTRLVKYLLDEFVSKIPPTDGISTKDSLNSVFCKTVKRVHPNTICRVLFKTFILHINGLIKNEENLEEHYQCYDIVQKLIWRVAKGLREQIKLKKVNVDRLLADINIFLEDFNSQEWCSVTQRFKFTNNPWQTVKSILSLLIHIYKEKIFTRLSLIPNSAQSPIYVKILHSLQSSSTVDRRLLEDKFNTSYENLTLSPKSSVKSLSLRSCSTSPIENIDDQLDRIFKRIRRGSTMYEGVQELREFRQQHPQAEEAVESRLRDLSHAFQMYIRRFGVKLDGEYLSRPASAESESSVHSSLATPTSIRSLKSRSTTPTQPTTKRVSMISSPAKSVFSRSVKSKSLVLSLSMFETPGKQAKKGW
ncbi:hypothetical protein K7432_005009 [Basidiobolus ranarum]|uniref:Uncharacterized protein n=1 Tax=Basidiobolus ranarum TaxID=34480 RepID=A0ABR2WX83_9FUNG